MKVGFPAMTKKTNFRDFVVDKRYIIHAQGFNEPLEGSLFEIEVADDGQVVLVMKLDNGTLKKIFVRAITGYSSSKKIAA